MIQLLVSNQMVLSAKEVVFNFLKFIYIIHPKGLVVLREMRATSKGGDGRNEQSHIFDEEEGIGCDLNLDAIGE